ncbi:hypothetical protein CHH75_07495 [Paenibacillus sp. 7541]|nr:hypothetical protein CHH75_07495 [Paenibacillus sp. 7541]
MKRQRLPPRKMAEETPRLLGLPVFLWLQVGIWLCILAQTKGIEGRITGFHPGIFGVNNMHIGDCTGGWSL